jgi:D-beta-D-heptose 7-phosphate kinase/D-beta-D-heptose 1-phosphate adenosyltransferase
MDKSRASELLNRFPEKRIVVVGDMMLDEYIWGHAGRISPEAPVMVVEAERYTHVPGGAANVVNNLCALGAKGIVVGVIGEDEAGRQLADALRAEGAETSGLIAASDRPTTRKTRVIAHSQHESQQLVRVDHERRSPIDDQLSERLASALADLAGNADAILLSDYQKGVLTQRLLAAAPALGARHKKPVTGNLKPASLLGLASGEGAYTILTLNHFEAATALESKPIKGQEELREAGRALLTRTGAEHILITQGSQGLTLFSQGSGAPTHVPARPVEVYDSAGAGDTVISALTLALACGATPLEAVQLANFAAAETVKKVGVSTVSREEILAGIE